MKGSKITFEVKNLNELEKLLQQATEQTEQLRKTLIKIDNFNPSIKSQSCE